MDMIDQIEKGLRAGKSSEWALGLIEADKARDEKEQADSQRFLNRVRKAEESQPDKTVIWRSSKCMNSPYIYDNRALIYKDIVLVEREYERDPDMWHERDLFKGYPIYQPEPNVRFADLLNRCPQCGRGTEGNNLMPGLRIRYFYGGKIEFEIGEREKIIEPDDGADGYCVYMGKESLSFFNALYESSTDQREQHELCGRWDECKSGWATRLTKLCDHIQRYRLDHGYKDWEYDPEEGFPDRSEREELLNKALAALPSAPPKPPKLTRSTRLAFQALATASALTTTKQQHHHQHAA